MYHSMRCWYKHCDSDDQRRDAEIVFFKFPKDLRRCERWIANCANPELQEVLTQSPEKIHNLRICQKHFLKELYEVTGRLVNHAVPIPYGISLENLDVREFLSSCINQSSTLQPAQEDQSPLEGLSCDHVSTSTTYTQLPLRNSHELDESARGNPSESNTFLQSGSNYELGVSADSIRELEKSLATPDLEVHDASYRLEDFHLNLFEEDDIYSLVPPEGYANSIQNGSTNDIARVNEQISRETIQELPYILDLDDYVIHENPPASNDGQMNLRILQPNQQEKIYPSQTILSVQSARVVELTGTKPIETPQNATTNSGNTNAQVISQPESDEVAQLKQKIRTYQMKLANARQQTRKYQAKFRASGGSLSKRDAFLESLNAFAEEMSPSLYEMIKYCVLGREPVYRSGLPDSVMMFAASLYMRSRAAYLHVKTTIPLPSESSIKLYIRQSWSGKDTRENNEKDDEDNDDDQQVGS